MLIKRGPVVLAGRRSGFGGGGGGKTEAAEAVSEARLPLRRGCKGYITDHSVQYT